MEDDGAYLTASQDDAPQDGRRLPQRAAVDEAAREAQPSPAPREVAAQGAQEAQEAVATSRASRSREREGEDQAIVGRPEGRLPVLLPEAARRRARATSGTDPRTYTIRDELGKQHRAYRMRAAPGVAGEYYGVQGTTWSKPPILDGPHDTRTLGGRKLDDLLRRPRLRLVAWQTESGVYWSQHAARVAQNRRCRRSPARSSGCQLSARPLGSAAP